LSRHGLDRDFKSWQFKKRYLNCKKKCRPFKKHRLDCQESFDSSKNDISTVNKSLDLSKNNVLIVKKVLTVQKPTFRHGLCPKILIFDNSKKVFRQFEKGHLDTSRHLYLDLDFSWLSRPQTLILNP
jgi:hypothetical protein